MRDLLRGCEQKEDERTMWKTGIHWLSYIFYGHEIIVNPRLVLEDEGQRTNFQYKIHVEVTYCTNTGVSPRFRQARVPALA
jgi:hypothetical protein